MKRPIVSIVLANLNGKAYLSEAFVSVVEQSFTDWELIVVDTGSTDGSQECIRDWAKRETRIRIHFFNEILNYPAAINRGIEICRGEFFARLESDDLWLPRKLERQIDFLNTPGNEKVGVCGTDVLLIDSRNRLIKCKRYPRTHEACASAIWYRNPLCHSSILARRKMFETVGAYNESQYLVEDLELWFRAMAHWRLANLPEPLVRYRVWDGSLSERRMVEIARRTRNVRRHAARRHGVRLRWPALLAYWSSYAAGALPPSLVRRAFQFFIDCLNDLGESNPRFRPEVRELSVTPSKMRLT